MRAKRPTNRKILNRDVDSFNRLRMIGSLLALFSAAVAAFSVVFIRKKSGESGALTISLTVTFVGAIILWPAGFLFANPANLTIDGVILFALAGTIGPGLSRLLYFKGLDHLGAPVNASIYATYPMFSSVFAVFFLGEKLTLSNWLGILLIVCGIILIQDLETKGIRNMPLSRTGLKIAIMSALGAAIAQIVRKQGLNVCSSPLYGALVENAFSLAFFLFLATLVEKQQCWPTKKDLRAFWAAGLGLAISWILTFYAVGAENVSTVTPILQIQPLFVVLFGYLYLEGKEQLSRKVIKATLLIILGLTLVTYKMPQ